MEVITYDALAMVREVKGFASRMEVILTNNSLKNLQSFQYNIHLQFLCSKVPDISYVLKTGANTVNFIQSRGLNHCQIVLFLKQFKSEFEELPYDTEVCCLSFLKVLKTLFTFWKNNT